MPQILYEAQRRESLHPHLPWLGFAPTSLSNPGSPMQPTPEIRAWVPPARWKVLDHFWPASGSPSSRSPELWGLKTVPLARPRARLPGTAGYSGSGGIGAAQGSWGLARAANGTQLDPPARLEEEGGPGRAPALAEAAERAAPLAWLRSQAPPLPFARQVSERARRDPACRSALQGALQRRRVGWGGVRPFKSQAWSLKGLPFAITFPFPG